jgi:predicted GIY-YIG superfamily endonuclease
MSEEDGEVRQAESSLDPEVRQAESSLDPEVRQAESSLDPEVRQAWYCYILRNRQPQYAGLTYVGSTNDPRRRLRQHNEEIVGGAKFTHGRGGGWEIYALVTGFPDHRNTLSCEWRIKKPTGNPRAQKAAKYRGVRGRIVGLSEVLCLDRWTGQCTASNADHSYTVFVAPDMIGALDRAALPPNITVVEGIPEFR